MERGSRRKRGRKRGKEKKVMGWEKRSEGKKEEEIWRIMR